MIPLKSLEWFQENSFWKLFCFCLMPNHLHFIVQLSEENLINILVGKFHSFTGHEIIKYLNSKNDIVLLDYFQKKAEKIKHDRQFLIWEDAFVRVIENRKVFFELCEYIHNNPVNKNWKLVEERSLYPYSSACFYDKGGTPLITISDFREIV